MVDSKVSSWKEVGGRGVDDCTVELAAEKMLVVVC